jgi:septum site-determining protein MinC
MPVQIKGIREGLLVSIDEGEWTEAEKGLLIELDRQKAFLKGARLILDLESHEINAVAMSHLRDQLSDQGLLLWGVLSQSSLTERSAQAMGLATRIHGSEPEAEEEAAAEEPEAPADGPAVLLKKTLRSGVNLTHQGDVTVIGDVNPGAQIVAGGNVVVWGRLRGLVHAGAKGDEGAVVCAMELSLHRKAESPDRRSPLCAKARSLRKNGRLPAHRQNSKGITS